MTTNSHLEVRNSESTQRYEVEVDGGFAELTYQMADVGTIILAHTEVSPSLRGRGIGKQVVAAALDDARARGIKVIPLCSIVALYMSKHPETQDLLAPGASMAPM
jgi:uncharacterized protein